MIGAGEKAFCAGGDIRAIYDEVVTGTPPGGMELVVALILKKL